MTNLDSIFKSRDITLPTKVYLVKAMVFLVVMYGCESWTIKKAEHWRIDGCELWCWRRPLRILWTARRSNQSILKEISPEYSLEGLILKLKLQHFCQMMPRTDSSGKDPDARKDWRQEEKGMTEDEMVGWHHRLNGHEFEQALGVGYGQGGLACYSPWGHKESDTTEPLNWTDLLDTFTHFNPILLQIHFEKQPLVWAVWALPVSPLELGTSYIIHMLLPTHSTPTDFSGPVSSSHSSLLFCHRFLDPSWDPAGLSHLILHIQN